MFLDSLIKTTLPLSMQKVRNIAIRKSSCQSLDTLLLWARDKQKSFVKWQFESMLISKIVDISKILIDENT